MCNSWLWNSTACAHGDCIIATFHARTDNKRREAAGYLEQMRSHASVSSWTGTKWRLLQASLAWGLAAP